MSTTERVEAKRVGSYMVVQKADVTDACVILDKNGNQRAATKTSYQGSNIRQVPVELDPEKGEYYAKWVEGKAPDKKPLFSVHGIINAFRSLKGAK